MMTTFPAYLWPIEQRANNLPTSLYKVIVHSSAAHNVRCPRLTTVSRPAIMTFIQDLLKPGGGIALIPFIRGTIATLLVLVM